MAFSLGEYQDIFLEEADEQLQELNQNLLELEKDPDNLEIINNIFRAAHSLKSSAAFVGLNDLSDLAHKMENLLQGIRDRTLAVNDEVVEIIFKCFDEIHAVIEDVSAGQKPERDLKWLIDEIQAVSDQSKSPETKSSLSGNAVSKPGAATVPKTVIDPDERRRIKAGMESGKSCSEITVFIEDKAQMIWVKAQLVVNNLARFAEIVTVVPSLEDLTIDDRQNIFKVIIVTDADIDEIRRAANVDQVIRVDVKSINITKKNDKVVLQFGKEQSFVGEGISPGARTANASSQPPRVNRNHEPVVEQIVADDDEEDEEEERLDVVRGPRRPGEDRKKISVLRTVKVSIDKLDLLLNNVGELVIANSGFYKLYEEMRKLNIDKAVTNEFKSRMEQMNRIAKDLQTGIMKTRMVPIGQVLNRFNRLVRDLARDFNRQVDLVIKGEDTELDKKVIDSIGEPLLHLIRNAVDHGIETAEERKRLGKSDRAHIILNAYQGGNQIFVEVSDDGKGLNLDLIKRKAVERGLATPEMIASMDNSDIYNFIFHPGFSTVEKVTDMSGRGVGMNVVREIVNELNGSVNIETEHGMGTRFVMAFPITLAIIPAIMTRVQREMYAIPLTDVIETIKIARSEITTIEGHEVINLRGEILSLLRLNRFISVKSALREEQKIPVVVVGFGNRKIGLIVDFLEGKQEIVIKSLEQNYKTVEGLAGASILGDGSICLILDIASMINKVITEQDRISRYDRDRVIGITESDYEVVEQELMPAPAGSRGDAGAFSVHNLRTPEPGPEPASTTVTKPDAVKPGEPPKMAESQKPIEQSKPAPMVRSEAPQQTAVKPSAAASGGYDDADTNVSAKVSEVLSDFRKELRESIKTTVYSGDPSQHMATSLDIAREDMNQFQVMANVGATNAAESLSRILKKRIDLSIPEVTIRPIEQIPKFIGDIDSVYMGIMMPVVGDTKGTMLFIFKEDTGFALIDLLYGTKTLETRELTEDGESALQELTNIVGSAVINVFAEKTGLAIKPGLPTIVHDYLQSVIDSILVMHNMVDEYAVVMDTSFYFEDDRIIGNLMLLPEASSMKTIVERMKSNVR